jgi:hypothetical protein
VVTPKHKRLVAPADAFDDGRHQAFGVMANSRGRGSGTRSSGCVGVRSLADDLDCAFECSEPPLKPLSQQSIWALGATWIRCSDAER